MDDLAAVQRALAALQARERAMDEAEAQRKARERAKVSLQALRAELTGKVAPDAVDAVHSILSGRGALVVDGEGAVRLKIGADDEPVDLRRGVSTYLASAEGKLFLQRPAAPPPAPERKPTAAELLAQEFGSADPPRAIQRPPLEPWEQAFKDHFGATIDEVI